MGEAAAKTLSIEELLRQVRDGRAGAWEELFQRSVPALKQWASHQLGRAPPAGTRPSDLVQETALLAFQRFASFKGGTEPELVEWLERIMKSRLVDLHRAAHTQKRGEGETDLTGEIDQLAAIQRSASQYTAQQEEWRRLLSHFGRLPSAQREALSFFYLEDLSVAEIARRMDKSEAAVASLLQRGLHTVRDRMANKPEEEHPDAITQNIADAALLLYMRKRQQGEQVDVERFVAGYPQCAEELHSLLHYVEALYALKSSDSE